MVKRIVIKHSAIMSPPSILAMRFRRNEGFVFKSRKKRKRKKNLCCLLFDQLSNLMGFFFLLLEERVVNSCCLVFYEFKAKEREGLELMLITSSFD